MGLRVARARHRPRPVHLIGHSVPNVRRTVSGPQASASAPSCRHTAREKTASGVRGNGGLESSLRKRTVGGRFNLAGRLPTREKLGIATRHRRAAAAYGSRSVIWIEMRSTRATVEVARSEFRVIRQRMYCMPSH